MRIRRREGRGGRRGSGGKGGTRRRGAHADGGSGEGGGLGGSIRESQVRIRKSPISMRRSQARLGKGTEEH